MSETGRSGNTAAAEQVDWDAIARLFPGCIVIVEEAGHGEMPDKPHPSLDVMGVSYSPFELNIPGNDARLKWLPYRPNLTPGVYLARRGRGNYFTLRVTGDQDGNLLYTDPLGMERSIHDLTCKGVEVLCIGNETGEVVCVGNCNECEFSYLCKGE